MSKTIIEVRCIDQVLTLTNTPVIASGGVGEDYVHFEFCEKWDGFAVSAVFWRKGVDCIPVLLDAENTCQVPPELMTSEGIVYFGAVGVAPDGTTRTSEPVSYLIREGTITENTVLPMPGEDVYQQLMSYYADVKLYVSTRIDEAAAAARAAEMNALTASMNAQKAQAAAEDAVGAVEGVIYPGIVEAVLIEGNNSMKIPLSVCPPDKMLLTFKAPLNDGTVEFLAFNAVKIAYPDADGAETEELFWVREGYSKQAPSEAIGFGDVVTVLLVRESGRSPCCYPLNSRITQTTLDEMGQRLHPGIPASVTADGTMTIPLDYVPEEDKMVLVFTADEASSQVSKFQLEYETLADGLIQVEYTLCDANNSPVESYGFYAGDYVVTLLTPADKRATVLNPRVTRDTMELIRGVLDNIPEPSGGGCETVTYTGSGEMSIYLSFSATPKVIHIDSLTNGGYNVSVTIYRDEQAAKLRVFSDGDYWENVVSTDGGITWGKSVLILLSDFWVSPEQLNVTGTKYIATGFM